MFTEIQLFKNSREFFEFALEEVIITDKVFYEFLDDCDEIEDLEQFKEACINQELYEWAGIIQRQLNELL